LESGLHTAEVRGYYAGRENRGPLFRVPMTVIKPRVLAPQLRGRPRSSPTDRQIEALRSVRGSGVRSAHPNELTETVSLRPGRVERRFVVVPDGATWLDLHFDLEQADTARTFVVHTVQTVAGHSSEDGEMQEYLNMEQGSRTVRSVPVIAGRTLEVCLAQYWSSLGESQLKMTLEFRGLLPDDDDLTLPSDGSTLEVAVTSNVRRERCEPSAALTTLRRLYRPASSEMEPLTSDRDRQLDGGPTHRLVLTYEFSQPSEGDVTIRVPELDGLLYDAPVESHEWLLFDANKALVATDDMYPEPLTLAEGDYTLRLELRHAESEVLESFEALPLVIDREDALSWELDLYSSPADAAAGETPFEARWLDPGERATLFLAGPAVDDLPDDAEPGDVLLGTITYVHSPDGVAGARTRPEGYPVRFVVPPLPENGDEANDNETRGDESLAARLKRERVDMLAGQLAELTWPDDEPLFAELSAAILEMDAAAQRRVLVAKLHLVDDDHREKRLPDVITAADEVIATIKPAQLARRLALRPDAERPKSLKQKKDAEELRDILADALYRKGRALAFQELPEVVELHPIEDHKALDRAFEQNFRELSRWVDTTGDDYYLLHIRRDRREERYGLALELLNEHIEKTFPPERQQVEKRRELFELLGWDDWREYDHKWLLIGYPEDWPPF
ncbi:MAG: tripeptidyl peptidase II, partial [Planctomycetaceae bacterium]